MDCESIMACSLSLFYLKRTLKQGKLYVIMGTILIPFALPLAFFLLNPGSFNISGVFAAYPLIMPYAGIITSIPVVSFFISDRKEGFYEYLFSTTETSVGKVYRAISLSSIYVTSIPLAAISIAALGISFFSTPAPPEFITTLLLFSIPLAYAAPVMMLIIGSTWSVTTMAIRGTLGNAPAGMAGIIVMIIIIVPVLVQRHLAPSSVDEFLGFYSLAVVMLLSALAAVSIRILSPERFLP